MANLLNYLLPQLEAAEARLGQLKAKLDPTTISNWDRERYIGPVWAKAYDQARQTGRPIGIDEALRAGFEAGLAYAADQLKES